MVGESATYGERGVLNRWFGRQDLLQPAAREWLDGLRAAASEFSDLLELHIDWIPGEVVLGTQH
jgi:hypothetical protein